MIELAPCSQCRRHVGTTEIACPFCGGPPPSAPKRITLYGRVSRAAVFASATLVACGGKKEDKANPPPSAGSALVAPADAAALADATEPDAAALPDAEILDAAMPADAAVHATKHRSIDKQHEQQRQELQQQRHELQQEHMHAKPYGAPPARRRLV